MASPWTLDEWLAHQSRVHPLAIDLGLQRLRVVLERLEWRKPHAVIVTVAGTNGKGSVTAYGAAILAAAGHRVGTFTSPHLIDYRERIRVDGEWVSASVLVGAFERIEAARLQSPTIPLTFFEYNALAAFLILQAADLDAWILEIGMGGRLDAVNLIDPDVAVIVSIGMDHQEFLGATPEAIGAEKAGILRGGIVGVLGSRAMPMSVERIAREVGAVLKRPGHEYSFEVRPGGWDYRGTTWRLSELPPPALAGETQFANAAAAIAALEEVRDRLQVNQQAVARGLTRVRLAGRFQQIPSVGLEPQWILDVAHNPDAAGVLAMNLRAHRVPGRTLALCAVLADKDLAGIVAALEGCIDEWWTATLGGARSVPGDELAARLRALTGGAPVHVSEAVGTACETMRRAAGPEDRIVIFGSFHTVGPALEWLQAQRLLPRGTLT